MRSGQRPQGLSPYLLFALAAGVNSITSSSPTGPTSVVVRWPDLVGRRFVPRRRLLGLATVIPLAMATDGTGATGQIGEAP